MRVWVRFRVRQDKKKLALFTCLNLALTLTLNLALTLTLTLTITPSLLLQRDVLSPFAKGPITIAYPCHLPLFGFQASYHKNRANPRQVFDADFITTLDDYNFFLAR